MSKSVKKVIAVIVVLVLILAVIWVVYESVKPEPASISATNELPNENMGLDNIINDIFENETNSTNENEVVNETVQNNIDEVNETENDENTIVNNDSNDSSNSSEVVSGTNTSREERAIEYAKQYYEEEYGSTDEIYFSCDQINGDGRYVVRVGTAGQGMNMFLIVNIDNGEVTEK